MCETLIWPKDKLTRFEVARLLGARTLQINLGAPLLVDTKEPLSALELAKLEFKSRVVPMTIKRRLPTGEEVVVEVRKGIENWLADHAGEI